MSDKLPHVEVHESICKSIGDIAKENEALKQRIKHLIELGLETSEYGLTIHRNMWEKEAEK